jgi:hypothetical protein
MNIMKKHMKSIQNKLLKFQEKVGAIKKDSQNPFFKSSYFNIDTLLGTIKPILNEVGLVLLQPLTTLDGKPALVTKILDSESEESIEGTVVLPENNDAQKMGGIITYFRRYCIQSMLSLEAEDDDGNMASHGQNSTKSMPPKPPANKPPVIPPKPPEKPLKTKEDLLKEEVKKLCDEIGLSTLTVLKTKEDYEKFVKDKTGFKLEPAFHNMILTRLKSIKSALEFEPVKT